MLRLRNRCSGSAYVPIHYLVTHFNQQHVANALNYHLDQSDEVKKTGSCSDINGLGLRNFECR